MVDYNEYLMWEGHIAVPITDIYNEIVTRDNRIDDNYVMQDFAKYIYEIIDLKKLNGNSKIEDLKSKLIDYQGKSFHDLYNNGVDLLKVYENDINPVIRKYFYDSEEK